MTIGDLLQKSGFGVRCLVDLLSALESRISAAFPITPKVIAAAHEAADAPDFERYGEEFDPRTGTGGVEIWIPIKA